MHYGTIKKYDIANGPGVRVSLFVSGCTHACEGCFNPETWNFTYGQPFTEDTTKEILDALRPEHIAGLTLLGGEPFEPDNQRALTPFLHRVREAYPEKNIWCYTGYLLDRDLMEAPGRILRFAQNDKACHPEQGNTGDGSAVSGFIDTENCSPVFGSFTQKLPRISPRTEVTDEMLSLIDVLVDGEFVLALKDITLKFRGSSNQRIIRLPL